MAKFILACVLVLGCTAHENTQKLYWYAWTAHCPKGLYAVQEAPAGSLCSDKPYKRPKDAKPRKIVIHLERENEDRYCDQSLDVFKCEERVTSERRRP